MKRIEKQKPGSALAKAMAKKAQRLSALEGNSPTSGSPIPLSLLNGKPKEPKDYKCSICKEIFPSRGAISKHSKEVHAGSKPFQCNLCGIGFTRRGTLRMHMVKHEKLNMTT